MSAPLWTRQKKESPVATRTFDRFFSLAGPRGGAHLTARVWAQANNCWHGTGMGAPDMRCGAKPCPVKPVTATVEYLVEYLVLTLGGSASVEPAVGVDKICIPGPPKYVSEYVLKYVSAAATCGLPDLALFSSRCGSLPPPGGVQNCTASRKGCPRGGHPQLNEGCRYVGS